MVENFFVHAQIENRKRGKETFIKNFQPNVVKYFVSNITTNFPKKFKFVDKAAAFFPLLVPPRLFARRRQKSTDV